MENYQFGTLNTISQASASIGGDFPVWSRRNKCYQGGGWIDTTDLNPGDVIHAGTPVIFQGPGQKVIIVKITDATNLPKVNGLIFDDVCIPSGVVEATCAVCYDGRIYANRANGGDGLPASLKAQLPAVEFVYEGAAPAEPTTSSGGGNG